MPKCKHHEICGLDAEESTGDGSCILHFGSFSKDRNAFEQALAHHRREKGDRFAYFVFPGATLSKSLGLGHFTNAVFACARFTGDTDFSRTTFEGTIDFIGATFEKSVSFYQARFRGPIVQSGPELDMGMVSFSAATFGGGADFRGAQFPRQADFSNATFGGEIDFHGAVFGNDVTFGLAKFEKKCVRFSYANLNNAHFERTQFRRGVDFSHAMFTGFTDFFAATFAGKVNFSVATFRGRTLFASGTEEDETGKIFDGAEVDFTSVILEPLDALVFRDADLQKCLFRETDLRKAEITGARWPKIGGRYRVYDEIAPLKKGETRSWPHIERLYRELKQNYEDRKDFERAGDFHYGEKEMRRKQETSSGLWFWLTLYKFVAGYGERYWRPLIWAGVLLAVSTAAYLWWGLLRFRGAGPVSDPVLHWANKWEVGLYSLKVMTLLKPTNFEPVGLAGDAVNVFQSIVGPVLIGLFALALRQRLKR